MIRKHSQVSLWKKSRKGEGGIDLGCIFLILILLGLSGCVSCGFSGCGVKVIINEEKK